MTVRAGGAFLAGLLVLWPAVSVSADKAPRIQEDDRLLECLKARRVPTFIYLASGVQLYGRVVAYTERNIVLRDAVSQMVYRREIGTIVPQYQSACFARYGWR